MSPEEWNDRRLDDLAAQVRVVGALATQVATNSANITGHDDDIRRLARMLEQVGEVCEAHAGRVERKLDEQAKAREWTLVAKLTLFSALFGPFAAALIVVLTKGG